MSASQAAPVEVLPCDRSAACRAAETFINRLASEGVAATYTLSDDDPNGLVQASTRHRQTHSTRLAGGGEIRAEAQFLCDRLDSLEWSDDGYADVQREYFGHVEPSHARLKALLAREGEAGS